MTGASNSECRLWQRTSAIRKAVSNASGQGRRAEPPPVPALKRSIDRAIATELDTPAVDEDDIIRVDTNLVSLNVSVFSNRVRSFDGMLEKNDFKVLENGREESIVYFATTDVPFDLVLLIDLSGSTADKRDLIRKSTLRFIAAARPPTDWQSSPSQIRRKSFVL